MDFQKLLLPYLVLINCVGFLLMGIDKKKAERHLWRIPEKSLFLAAIFGGSVGSILGMKVFHHKTRKMIFVVGMPLILILQIALAVFFFYEGKGFLFAKAESLEEFSEGDGTPGNPYRITNTYQFNAIRKDLSAHYRLEQDIRFRSSDFAPGGDFYTEGTGFRAFGSYETEENPTT